jgi:hypothetical protein
MAKRTIRTGIGSYVDLRGVPTYGFQGDEVEVHDDFVEEFDAGNVVNGDGEPAVHGRADVDVVSPAVPVAPKKTAAPKKA